MVIGCALILGAAAAIAVCGAGGYPPLVGAAMFVGCTAGFFVAFLLLWVLFLFFATLGVKNAPAEKFSRFYRVLLMLTDEMILGLSGVRGRAEGTEKLPDRFLLVCNHRSNFDPLITLKLLRDIDLVYLSKPENFKIPLAGKLCYACRFLPIDRDDPVQSIAALEQAATLLRGGTPVAVYPEGTRNKAETGLLPFHASVFRAAKKAGAPVAVGVMTGTGRLRRQPLWRRGTAELKIVEIIPEDEVAALRTRELGERARQAMERALEEEGV